MKISYQTFWRMVKTPDRGEIALIHRYYCTPLYMNSRCTTHCMQDCAAHIQRIHNQSHGEFILKPMGFLVVLARAEVADIIEKGIEHKAETPKNDLGESVPETDPFATLAKMYEITTTVS